MLLENPKSGVVLFATSLILLHETAATTHRTSSPQPLPCDTGANKIYNEIIIHFLNSGEQVGVIWMLPSRVALHLTSSLTLVQCTSLNFTLQLVSMHHPTQMWPTLPITSSTSKVFQNTELGNHSCKKTRVKFFCIFALSFCFRCFVAFSS